MKSFPHDSADNFESRDASAQTSEAKATGAALERPGETNASRDRADGARRHAPDAAEPAADARADAKDAGEEEIEITEVVSLCESMIRPMAEKAGIDFSVAIDENLPHVFADPTKLQQILINLLSNAVKFTPAPGSVRVTIGTDLAGRLKLQIADTGIGIPAEKIDVALAPFGQVDSRLSRKYDGVGLGLPLTKCLVELHGGSLEITSECERGTVVTVLFPKERLFTQIPLRAAG